MEFVKMYNIFKTEAGKIWKIETAYIPKEDLEHWKGRDVYQTIEELIEMGIKL